MPGTRIEDLYELDAPIGKGAHGVVWRARDLRTGELVAIKFLAPSVSSDPQYTVRLLRESQAMAALAGTSAIHVHGLRATPQGAPYLVMDLLVGRDLEQHLDDLAARGARMSAADVIRTLDPVVDTLEAAHHRGIVHRDLKPANVYLLDAGGVRLLDFGLAKVMAAAPLTQDGMIAGSPSYIAPEVWAGNPRALDHRIDVYSLGAIAFRALAGRVPFDGESVVDKWRQATTAERPSLHALRPDLPPEVDSWVAEVLAIHPDARFQNVRACWNALRATIGPTDSLRAPSGPLQPLVTMLPPAPRTRIE